MPTQQTTYNSRVTDEALEKKFRDTFKSQGGAELVDDLYAQGVIVPIVDFTAAAQGSELRSDLQTAWDFSTGNITISNTTQTFITTPGFWQVDLNWSFENSTNAVESKVEIDDGTSRARVWEINVSSANTAGPQAVIENKFIVFLRSGDSLRGSTNSSRATLDIWYRQIADVSGNLQNPLGFTSS